MKLRFIFALLLVAAAGAGLALAADSAALWIDVPYIAQAKDGCGSASISMVMQYWENKSGLAVPADAKTIQSALFSPSDGGILASKMQAYFRESGYRAFAFQGAWSDLEHHIQQGRPLIVGLKASGPHEPFHYVVVVGIDSARGYIFVNDPARQKMQRISRQGFESEWSYTRNWTLLAVPRAAD